MAAEGSLGAEQPPPRRLAAVVELELDAIGHVADSDRLAPERRALAGQQVTSSAPRGNAVSVVARVSAGSPQATSSPPA